MIKEITRKILFLKRSIYYNQVKVAFNKEVLLSAMASIPILPEGYYLEPFSEAVDLQRWADLLNADGEFGEWSPERLRKDILSSSIAPAVTFFLYHSGTMVGTVTGTDAPIKRRKIGMPMWLIIVPSHRGRVSLSKALVLRMFAAYNDLGYEKLFAFTDPHRLPALTLYYLLKCVPVYDSLSSFYHWKRINQRLVPILARGRKGVSKVSTV